MVIDKADKLTLMGMPAFHRFLLSVVEMSGIYASSPDVERMVFREGRRSVGLEILRMMDDVQPVPNACGLPADTSIQLLREAVQSATKIKPNRPENAYAELTHEIDAE